MRRAIADRINVGQARLTEAVDAHAIGTVRTRSDQRFDRGHDADPDDDEIGGDHLAVGSAPTGDVGIALDRLDTDAQDQVDAMTTMPPLVEARPVPAPDAPQPPGYCFDSHPLLSRPCAH